MACRVFLAVALVALCVMVAFGEGEGGEIWGVRRMQIEDGSEVDEKHCLLKKTLRKDMRKIEKKMIDFGISDEVSSGFRKWVVRRVGQKVVGEKDMVCLLKGDIARIGSELGTIILDYLSEHDPTKTTGNRRDMYIKTEEDTEEDGDDEDGEEEQTSVRNESPQFEWDGEDRDESFRPIGNKKCCSCDEEDDEFLMQIQRNCDKNQCCHPGPCCPGLCAVIEQQLEVSATSEGRQPCCVEAGLPCLHEREGDNSEGARGGGAGGPPKFVRR